MDLEQYVSNYSGVARTKRLTFIAQKNKEQAKPALQLLIKELKAGINTTAYKEVIEQAQKRYKKILFLHLLVLVQSLHWTMPGSKKWTLNHKRNWKNWNLN